ncbi:MAG: DMT family transporter [Promethearchaeota archaeon]
MARTLSYLSLIVAAICFGTIPVFSFYLSSLGVPSLQQSLFRALFTVLYLFIIIGGVYRFRNQRIKREHLPWFILYGLLGVGASIIAYITAIAIGTPVIVAVSLTYLYPSFTLILARIFLQEHLTRLRVIAVPLSIIGAIVVSLPVDIGAMSIPVLGIILSIANGVFAACYVVLGRKWGGHEGYPELTTTFWGYILGLLWMGPLILGIHFVISDPRIVGFQIFLSPTAWLLLLGFALIGTTIPYTLTNVGVKNIDASAASILLLLDPISAVIMGYFFMNQPVAFWQFIGATLILLATVLIAIESKSDNAAREIPG